MPPHHGQDSGIRVSKMHPLRRDTTPLSQHPFAFGPEDIYRTEHTIEPQTSDFSLPSRSSTSTRPQAKTFWNHARKSVYFFSFAKIGLTIMQQNRSDTESTQAWSTKAQASSASSSERQSRIGQDEVGVSSNSKTQSADEKSNANEIPHMLDRYVQAKDDPFSAPAYYGSPTMSILEVFRTVRHSETTMYQNGFELDK